MLQFAQRLDRRRMLSGLSAAGIAALAGCTAGSQMARTTTFFERASLPLGLQVYTLGPDAGKDLDATFASIAEIGYREIEMPNLFGQSPASVRESAERAGLSIASLHLPLVGMPGAPGLSFASDSAEIADSLGTLGARWAVAPLCLVPDDFRPNVGESFGDAISRAVLAAGTDLWKRSADVLNNKGSTLKPLGIGIGYHNHNLEFAPVDGTRGWDILWQETDPALVSFEVDTGWVATAGLDPVAFLEHHAGRVSLVHVKDVAADNPMSYKIGMRPAEVGAGVLDWNRILPAAYRAGARHFLVEQEPPFTIPRIEAAERSYAYLASLDVRP